ncbi:BTAD domain-containing putative transcriptional regulator [Actinomadura fulvescens]|uniref:Bacterial transcriptional activator domain-containing protein n=1 Tax=Actinomadura fulvescens TaxID=46160 RepID=A0ABN3Q8U5_9ACTN
MAGSIEPSRPPAVAIQIFGNLEVRVNGRQLDLGTEQMQRMLVGLLAAGGRPVSRDTLLIWIWDEIWDTPERFKSQVDALHQLVRKLRRRLESVGLHNTLTWRNGCYAFDMAVADVDLHRFAAELANAGQAMSEDEEQAAELLEVALRRVRGEPLAGLNGRKIEGFRVTLEEEMLNAELTLNQLRMRNDRHLERISQLTALAAEHPDNEMVTWLLMHALYRSGRQDDALKAFRDLRARLVDRDGLDILQPLSDLHDRMLRGDPELWEPDAVVFPGARTVTRPRSSGTASPSPAAEERAEEPGSAGDGQEEASDGVSHGREPSDPSPAAPHAPGTTVTTFHGPVVSHGVIGTVHAGSFHQHG